MPKLCSAVILNHEPGTCPRFMMHFQFLEAEWPDLFESASKAEALTIVDPRTFCFYALELANCKTV
jgi:hypothetical protein